MLFALLIFLAATLTVIAHVDGQIKGIALDLPESVADFALANLLDISPECTGEIRHIVNGKWRTYEHRSAIATVRVKLLRKASPKGLDPETGAEMYDYEDLPGPVQDAVRGSDPRVVSKVEGEVAVIGSNLLAAWGLQVDAYRGLIRCGNALDAQVY
jgi:hypothetical protein